MSVPLTRYAYDPTGINPDNLVIGEIHTLSANQARALATKNGAYFTDPGSLRVYDHLSNQILERGTQYQVIELVQDVTMRLGKEVCLMLLIIDRNVSNKVRINYQALGGMYQNTTSALIAMYETISQDNRPIDFANILNKPTGYLPTEHFHLLSDVYGFEPVVQALERVRNAIILSDVPAFEEIVNWAAREIDALKLLVSVIDGAQENVTGLLQNEANVRALGDSDLDAKIVAEKDRAEAAEALLRTAITEAVSTGSGSEAALRIAGDAATLLAANQYTQSEISTAINAIVNGAQASLDTLNELATALNNDANFAANTLALLAGKQAGSSILTALAGLPLAGDKLVYSTGADTFGTTDLSPYGRTLIASNEAVVARATLELGDAAIKNVGIEPGTLASGDHAHNEYMLKSDTLITNTPGNNVYPVGTLLSVGVEAATTGNGLMIVSYPQIGDTVSIAVGWTQFNSQQLVSHTIPTPGTLGSRTLLPGTWVVRSVINGYMQLCVDGSSGLSGDALVQRIA